MPKNSPRLEFGPQFRTGINIIDEQHQVLFDLINRVDDLLQLAVADTVALGQAIEGVANYALYHFVTEESLAYRSHYAAQMGNHIHQHNEFRKKIVAYRDAAHGRDLGAVAQELLRYLKHWLVSHILHTDVTMCREIRRQASLQAKPAQTPAADGLRIAVVEDNNDMREEIVYFLSHVGHQVVGLENGAALNRHMMDAGSDVIVLDLGLPDIDGTDLIARYGGRDDVAIVVMTARGSTEDRIAGYRGGADAYLVKPVDMRELVAVIDRAVQRLYPPAVANAHAWRFSPSRWLLLTPDGDEITLTEQQATLIGLFIGGGRRTLLRKEIATAMDWTSDAHVEDKLESCLSRLRHKLEENGARVSPLKTIRGVGYSFAAPLLAVT